MKEFKSFSANPVGQKISILSINNFIETTLDSLKNKIGSCPWWKFWAVVDWTKATGFFIVSIDKLILMIANEAIPGADKKATVLAAIDKFYDVLIISSAPIWLKPIVIASKGIIINTVCSMFIDWVVSKYKDGSWRKDVEEEKTQM